jgi:hypothetical protein
VSCTQSGSAEESATLQRHGQWCVAPLPGLEDPKFPLSTPSHYALELFKTTFNTFVADEPTVDDPEDLAGKSTAQSSLYAHRGQDNRTLATSRGRLTPDTPPPNDVVLKGRR